MSVFIRRFTEDPGLTVLSEIESVDILDLTPPGVVLGVGSGTAHLVGEFEDGPFETPTEIMNSGDLVSTFGEFGYTYNGVVGNNPCARSRKVDGVTTPEYWNGNGAIALNSKRFRRLILTRVDTSVGEVEFTRQCSITATLTGATNQTWAVENEQEELGVIYGDGVNVPTDASIELDGEAATATSGAGTYPSTFVGGETLVVVIDEGTGKQLGSTATPITVTFSSTDQTHAQVVARINEAVGYEFATIQAVDLTVFTGRTAGTKGSIKFVSASALVESALDLTALLGTTVFGTGSVGDLSAVTLDDLNANMAAETGGDLAFDRDASGRLRLYATEGSGVTWMVLRGDNVESAVQLGFVFESSPGANFGFESSQPTGYATTQAVGTYPSTFTGGEFLTLGVDDETDVTVTFQVGDQTAAQVAARINAAMGFNFMTVGVGTQVFMARKNGGEIRIVGGTPLALTNIFNSTGGMILRASANASVPIPAGTRVQNVEKTKTFVTMQTVIVRGEGTDNDGQLASGPYSIPVRHALDDGTGTSAAADTLTYLPAAVVGSSDYFTVTNPEEVSAALNEAQIDAKYVDALDQTKSPDNVSSQTNLIWTARSSNTTRNALRMNARDASASGCQGRIAVVRPLLGTTRSVARSAMQPGVNAYRDQRLVYVFPGMSTFVKGIAARGIAGGAGFTVDGVIDVGAESMLVSVCSQLNPEENPGQVTGFTGGALGIEKNNPDVQNMTIEDYIAFKASGICAPRMDDGVLIFQSGVTSVNPQTTPELRNIARRRMADFIQDSLARRLKNFGKKLSTTSRRAAVVSEIRSFMNILLSTENPAAQRIDGFSIDLASGNTPQTLGLGIFRVILRTRTLASLDNIVLATTIGELVDVAEAA